MPKLPCRERACYNKVEVTDKQYRMYKANTFMPGKCQECQEQ